MEVLWRWRTKARAFGLVLSGSVMLGLTASAADRVRLASYNVENYLLTAAGTREVKSEAAREKVVESLRACAADLLALQEVGGEDALQDLRRRLGRVGLDYAHHELVRGADTNIQVALLSRWPITRRQPHVHDSYLVSGRRFRVSRGFLEAEVKVSSGYSLTVLVAHLKSRRAMAEADEAEMRKQEALLLRKKMEACTAGQPRANVVLLGDLNDTKDTEPVRILIGRGGAQWTDARPAERNGDTGFSPNPRWQPRTVSWTHYYGVEDSYSRVDYILLHPNTVREWVRAESFIPVVPDWGRGSDHRPVVVTLEAKDR
ncbi:MAG: endonuclease/exonuclease/phosphatase family protein [Verrucomicrobiales bacterium]|nr:endonuclease/exonuclease/phosphatase family protein [Verrucomicrobiales bacterium]